MKLTLVTQHFAPDFEGGTEALVRAQALALLELDPGLSVRIIAGTNRAHDGRDVLEEEVDGLRVAFLPRLPDEHYDLALARPRMAALVASLTEAADLVHVHHHSTLHGTLVQSLARADRPVVMSLHDLFVTCPRWFRVPPDAEIACGEHDQFEPCVACVRPDAGGLPDDALLQGLTERARSYARELSGAALVCVPSRAHGERLLSLTNLNEDRLRVIPNGLVRPLPRVIDRGWSPEREPLRALYLGHLASVKGLDDLVAAIDGLADADRERIELHCLGQEVDAELSARLDAAERRVTLVRHGGYPGFELAQRVAAIAPHLALLPSRAYESYGLTLDECQALGLATWVSDRGAPSERVGAAGRVLSACEPVAWGAALKSVLANPLGLESERLALPSTVPGPEVGARALLTEYQSLLRTRP